MNVRLNSFYDPRPSQFVSAMEALMSESVKFSEATLATRGAELKDEGIDKEANDTTSKLMIEYCKEGEFLRTL
jgi:hypothetical protein